MVPTLLLAAVAATATPTVTPTVTATPVPAFARLLDAQGVAATPTPAPAALGSKVKLRATRITDRPDDPAALVLARRPTPEPGATAGPDSRDAQFKEQCAKLYPGKFDEQLDCVKALRAIAERQPTDVPPETFATMRAHCRERWPEAPSMQDYCERHEIEAWRTLQAR